MTIIEPNQAAARTWIEQSLTGGQLISAAVLEEVLIDGGRFRVWISDEVDPSRLPRFREGGVAKESESEEWLEQALDELTERGAQSLVVEDWLARPSDPALARSELPFAFIQERVVSWSSFPPEPGAFLPAEVIRVGGRFPTNAFVVTRSASELGLMDRQELPKHFPAAVAQSLGAIVVSIYDAESYLVWESSVVNEG